MQESLNASFNTNLYILWSIRFFIFLLVCRRPTIFAFEKLFGIVLCRHKKIYGAWQRLNMIKFREIFLPKETER